MLKNCTSLNALVHLARLPCVWTGRLLAYFPSQVTLGNEPAIYLKLYGEIFMILAVTAALLTFTINGINLPALYESDRGSCVVVGAEQQQSNVTPMVTQDVVATQSEWLGKCALKLELTAEEQARQLASAGGNRPTLIILGKDFTNAVNRG